MITVSSVLKMTSKMLILTAIATCTVLGELLAIIATAGKEWEKFETKVNVSGIVKEVLWTYGLWEYCQDSKCRSIKKFNELRKESVRGRFFQNKASFYFALFNSVWYVKDKEAIHTKKNFLSMFRKPMYRNAPCW